MKIWDNFNKTDKKHLTTASFCYVLEELGTVSMMFVMMDMMNMAISGTGLFSQLHYYWICLAALLVLKTIFHGKAELEKHNTGYSITENIRRRMILKLKKFSLGFYTKERLGEIESIIHKDVDTVELVAAHVWSSMFGDFALTLIVGAILAVLSFQMFIAMIILLPLGVYVLISGLKENIRREDENKEEMINMVSLFIEYAQGMSVLKSFNQSSLLDDKLKKSTGTFKKKSIKATTSEALVLCRYSLCLDLSFAFLAITGGILLYYNLIAVTELLLFLMLSKEFYKSFTQLEAYFLYYIRLEGSFKRIRKILLGDVIEDPSHSREPDSFHVYFENTNFSYDEGFGLKNINLEVKEGELVALVGHSGSGKTTLTNLLLQFYDPDSGAIRIGGIDIRDMKYDTLLENISVVMQDVILFSDTILENIKLGNSNATESQVIEAAQKAEIHDFITSLSDGYNTVLTENGGNLSGGQKQRLAIARAFIKDAPIVILDEATSNVDPINERKIQKAISELTKGKTVLVIAHHLKTIRNADRIAVFNDGEIVEFGSFNELIDMNGLFMQLWESQDSAERWMLFSESNQETLTVGV